MAPKKRSPGDGGFYWIESKKLWRRVWDDEPWSDGRRRQRSVTGRTQKIVNEKYDRIMAERARNIRDPKMTVQEWAQLWLEDFQRPKMSPNGYASYESMVRLWINPTIGSKRVCDLKGSDVSAVLSRVRSAGKSTGTMRKAYNVLSQLLDAAKKDELTDRNVADLVTPPKVQAKERGALTTEDAFAVLEAAARRIDGSKWWATLLAGLRQGERLGARIESLDLDAGTMRVEWSLTEVKSEHGCEPTGNGWSCGMKRGGSCPQRRLVLPDGFDHIHLYGRLVLKRPKSGRPRTIPLAQPLVEALRLYLAETEHIPNPHGLLWRHDDGTPFLPAEDEQAWRDLLHDAGVITAEQAKEPRHRAPGTPEPPTTHWGRHTAATVMMELGVDTKVVGEVIGHVDAKTTHRYQHVSSALAREGMNRLGTHYAKVLERTGGT